MADRTRIGIQVWNIANKHNIPKTTVHEIINTYIKYCRQLLLNGERVDFLGLVSIVPDVITTEYETTLAYRCEEVADMLGLTRITVYSIIRAYIDDAIQSVLDGVVTEIRGIVTMRPIFEDGKLVKVHSFASQSFKKTLAETDTIISSIRVHTYKSLRDSILWQSM